GEVVRGEQAAVALAGAVEPCGLLREADERLGHEPSVEGAARRIDLLLAAANRLRLADDLPVRARERRIAEERQRLGNREVELGGGRPVLVEEPFDATDRLHDPRNERIAVLRVADREAHHVPERQRPEVAEQQHPAVERTRDDGGKKTRAGNEVEPELVAVALDRRRARSDALRAEDERLAALRRPDDRGQVAARTVPVRLNDLERQAGGDGRVERVAALLEDRHPGR